MSEQFDKELINHINEVFDDFVDDSADAGWIEVQKRLPQPKKRRKAGWWISSAAAVLLLIGGWYLISTPSLPEKREKLVSKPSDKITNSEHDGQPSASNAPVPDISMHSRPFKAVTDKRSGPERSVKGSDHKKSISLYIQEEISSEPVEVFETQSQEDLTILALGTKQQEHTQPGAEAALNAAFDPSPETAEKEIAPADLYATEAKQKLHLADLPYESNDQPKSNSKLNVAVFAGSYITYAEGSETSLNTGFGISSEIKLGKKISFSTGISLAQNSLKFNTAIPQQAKANFARTAHLSESLNFSSPGTGSPGISIQSYDARLLGFDIPFNLKYLFLQRKNSVYLITGISSNFFINESYTYNYTYGSNINKAENEPDSRSSGRFQSFNLARVVNFSLGYEQTLNQKTKISFEPFIKYPVSGLGSHDLRFGAAGMNLKFNFNR